MKTSIYITSLALLVPLSQANYEVIPSPLNDGAECTYVQTGLMCWDTFWDYTPRYMIDPQGVKHSVRWFD